MKTAKSIIVVLFVLLTAQIASAYYCPSTGRWLSRDPIGELGFQVITQPGISVSLPRGRWINRDLLGARGGQNLYWLVANNPMSRIDALGLYAFDMEVKVYIEGTRVTFAGRTFNTGTKADHVVHVDTDSESITQSKFIGTTIEYDSSGNEIGRGTAPSTGLTASIKCKPQNTRFGCCKQCNVDMSGSAADPLFHGLAPGIDYEFHVIVTVCPKATALSYAGSHDGYPSYDFSVAGENVHHYSHVTAGTSPISLYPWTKGIYFNDILWVMTGL